MPKPILLIQTAFIGDLLLSIPLLKQIKSLSSQSPIHLICRKGLGEFFLKTGLVSVVHEVDKTKGAKIPFAQLPEFKWVICPHESFRSATYVARIKSKRKIGFLKPWNFWAFHSKIKRDLAFPEALRQLSLLTLVDKNLKDKFSLLLNTPDKFSLSFSVPEWASMDLKSFFSSRESEYLELLKKLQLSPIDNKSVFLSPGSVWGTKMWTGYKELGSLLSSKGYKVIIMGAPAEVQICKEVEMATPGSINLSGKTSLYDSAHLLNRGGLLICNDSGAMHLAASQNTPTIAIFGPTVLDFGYRPWQNRALVLEKDSLPCRPCGKHGPMKCPLKHHECMNSIGANDVFKLALEMLNV